jgi:E-phenylitaconyl-CoA hydratase
MPIRAADLSEPFDEIQYDKWNHIAFITLNRPQVGNAMTVAMHERIRSVWADIQLDPDIRVAVITGAGSKHFCTGADISGLGGSGPPLGQGHGPMSEELFWSPRYCNVWKPVIAAVNGVVAGGGLHFVVDADIIIASESAQFLDTHVSIGQVGAVENIGLAKRLPLGTALRMTLMGRSYRLSARRAYELGFVDEVVGAVELMATATQIAVEIAKNSPAAVSLSKQAVWQSLEVGYGQAMEYGWSLLRMHWSHADCAEGPAAFRERRDPTWTVG